MDRFDALQQILGTSRKNPVFSVSRHSQTNDYHVYYGAELFEIVPSDHEDTRFKLMVAHLYSIGANLAQLQRAFGIDPRTIKNWSAALKSGDAEKLTRALAGRQCGRKLTPAAETYVRIRFRYIYAVNRRSYSRRIREELKEVLKIEVSGETLRPLLGELKAEYNGETSDPCNNGDKGAGNGATAPDDADQNNATRQGSSESEAEDAAQASAGTTAASEGERASQGEQEPGKVALRQDDGVQKPEEGEGVQESDGLGESVKPCEAVAFDKRSAPSYRKKYVDLRKPRWCSHLGLLFFSEPLSGLREVLGEEHGAPVCQWASQVLLGAANLEQTKLQSGQDLGLLLGPGLLGGPDHQRKILGELAANAGLVQNILRWNFQRVGGPEMSDFYFDAHTKHYTGKQNVLKGWCAKIRWADKVMHGDFVHSTGGHPLYLENTDNYEDMRQRFKKLEDNFRTTLALSPEKELSWVIDRGIFSMEIFEWVLENPKKHLITWEKDYQRDAWAEGQPATGSMKVERSRNNKADKQSYSFEWIEDQWPKNTKLRRIIVRAQNPEGNRVEVSILADDSKRAAKEIVWLMFDRWIQENDFKYLDEHFGISQITSYRSQTYAQIRGELEDREMKNAAHTALQRARREEHGRMGKLLVAQRESKRKGEHRVKEMAKLEALKKPDKEQRQRLGRLKGTQRSAERYTQQRDEKIDHIQKEIDGLDKKMEETDKEVSRLDHLVEKGAQRLCGERKLLMDVIKITARNLFCEMLAPFKETYDNYRDDHVWFRHLTRSGGVIEPKGEEAVRCHLIAEADYPKPVSRVIRRLLARFNRSGVRLPDGSDRKTELVLGSKSAIELASQNA